MAEPSHPAEQQVMDAGDVERALSRIAHEIVEANRGTAGLCLVGIRRGGVPLAQRLAREIAATGAAKVPTGVLDIGLYRDDAARMHPLVGPTDIPFSVQDQAVVLVDDVLYTGRTVRAALDELMDFGRPRRVYLAVLADRGGRELPICADFTGRRLECPP
ncbi:MAG: bifunctional pyr operon transcriptional regulator/uracil phosphoribosyltransferase PyrR, partial [Myxococcales bacterium]